MCFALVVGIDSSVASTGVRGGCADTSAAADAIAYTEHATHPVYSSVIRTSAAGFGVDETFRRHA